MTVKVGTLRVASALILLLDVASESSVSVILQTQHAASLLACMFNPNRSLESYALMTDLFLIHYLNKINHRLWLYINLFICQCNSWNE